MQTGLEPCIGRENVIVKERPNLFQTALESFLVGETLSWSQVQQLVKIQHPLPRSVLPTILWLPLRGEVDEGHVPLKGLSIALIMDGGRFRDWDDGLHSADTASSGSETIGIKQEERPSATGPRVHVMPVSANVIEGWHLLWMNVFLVY